MKGFIALVVFVGLAHTIFINYWFITYPVLILLIVLFGRSRIKKARARKEIHRANTERSIELERVDQLESLKQSQLEFEEQLFNLATTHYDDMSGIEFEEFCAKLLRRNDFKQVQLTKGSGDRGVDILAIKDDVTYAFQCKCLSKNAGRSAVQQINTGRDIYRTQIGVVITNRGFNGLLLLLSHLPLFLSCLLFSQMKAYQQSIGLSLH